MSNSTKAVAHYNDKNGNLYLLFRAGSHTIYATHDGCFIFHPVKFGQTMTNQRVLLRRESVIDGTAVPMILCLHILITHRILINI